MKRVYGMLPIKWTVLIGSTLKLHHCHPYIDSTTVLSDMGKITVNMIALYMSKGTKCKLHKSTEHYYVFIHQCFTHLCIQSVYVPLQAILF